MQRALTFLTILFLLAKFLPTAGAQAPKPQQELFQKIRGEIYDGKKWALRDMATFLDDPNLRDDARNILFYATMFTPAELDWTKVKNKTSFFNFFYPNQEKLRFDPVLFAFYITPLEKIKLTDFSIQTLPNQPVSPEKKLKSAHQNLRSATEKADTTLFRQSVQTLAELAHPDAWKILLDLARNNRTLDLLSSDGTFSAREQLLWALRFSPDEAVFDLALGWLKTDKITPQQAEIPLSEMTNQYIRKVTKDDIIGQLRPLHDSLGSLAALRLFGNELYPTEPLFYEENIDYQALIYSLSWAQPWARHNAMHAILHSEHPRSLYYLACRAYRNRYETDADVFLKNYIQPIEERTGESLRLPDETGTTTAFKMSPAWVFNHLHYWAIHWPDYEWDEKRGHFVNRFRAESQTENFDRLFRRLSSTNDSVAVAAFRLLAEGNPAEILPLAEKYRPTIRNANPALPSFKNRFLEQLSLLTDACRDGGFEWQPSPSLTVFLKKIKSDLPPTERYSIENQMIESLTLADATALEFEALVEEPNRAFGFSASHALDALYTRHWSQLLADDRQLRFFLKKSALFKAIGTIGSANFYLQKFDLDQPAVRKKLEEISLRELDPDVLGEIHFLFSKKEIGAPNPAAEIPGTTAPAAENQPLTEQQFRENLELLRSRDSLPIEVFNAVLTTPFYKPAEHKTLILNALPRLRPTSMLRRLSSNAKFSLRDDLVFFEKFDLKLKDWPSLLRLFNGDAPERLLEFLSEKTTSPDASERGKFFNEILRTDYLRRYLGTLAASTPRLDVIRQDLQTWFDADENLNEFDEENATLHLLLLKNVGKPLSEKLEATFGLDISESGRHKIQLELLATASFSMLKQIAPLLERLAPDENGQPGGAFLMKDFGIPPLDFSEKKAAQLLLENLSKLPEADFYKFYLRRFGVKFESPGAAQTLDFQAIHRILKFDLLVPFAGGGGEKRDWYIFSLVKVLEKHFGQTLGFHEKLNENQTFYTFNAGKRAAAWAAFLEEKGLAKAAVSGKSWNNLR